MLYKLMKAVREAEKKVIFLMAVPLRGGGVVGIGLTIKKKNPFFLNFFLFFFVAIKK